jgi:hypothetical protein
MADKKEVEEKLAGLVSKWPSGQESLKQAFLDLAAEADDGSGVTYDLIARPGVSYSLRAQAPNPDRGRPVFFLVDVVVSEKDPWFLSVCFYADEVDDPDQLGDAVPQGLFDETGYCFDVEDFDNDLMTYLKARVNEARKAASAAA